MDHAIGLDVYILTGWYCTIFFLQFIVTFPFPIKESAIILLVAAYLVIRRKLHFDRPVQWICIVSIIYYGGVSIWKEGISLGISGALSMLSWWGCLLVGTLVDRNQREIAFLLRGIKLACICCAVLIAVQNPPFSGAVAITIGTMEVNRNEVVERILPGLLVQSIQHTRTDKIPWHGYLSSFVLIYACLLPQSRGGFVSVLLTMGFVFADRYLKKKEQRGIRYVGNMVLAALIAIILVGVLIPSSYTNRLWRIMDYRLDDTGRLELWKDGIAMVSDPIFGMGPSYYELHSASKWRAYGVHNMFIDLYIAGGIIMVALICLLFRRFIRKDLIVWAFFSLPLMRTMVEAGRSYGTWGVLMLMEIMLCYCDRKGIMLTELFDQIYEKPEVTPGKRIKTCIRSRQGKPGYY